jgi:hypothetical protein
MDHCVGSETIQKTSTRVEMAGGRRYGEIEPWKAVGRIAYFLGIVALLAFVMNAVVTSGLRRDTNSEFGVWNQVMGGKVNAQVVITGSSRAALEYDPRIIESVTGRTSFNLGRNGNLSWYCTISMLSAL